MPTITPVDPPVDTSAEPVQPYAAEVLAGDGAAVSLLRLQIMRISPHFRTALVTGERGTGKETVAREMHRLSGAATGPFTRMEVASFAQELEPVDLRGVLFLQGLERLEPALQERLAVRLKQIQREIRIVFASECDLRGMMAAGRLRQNLSSRVGGLEIRVASLRDRMEDLDVLAASMLQRMDAPGRLSEPALDAMRLHDWPRNLAELWQVMRQLRRVPGEITLTDLPDLAINDIPDDGVRLEEVLHRHVFDVLQRCAGNKLRAAKMLGISRSTLYRMLEAAGESSVS